MNAIYVRQSVDKQDSLSIETQIESCTRVLDGKYTVYQDKGFSGKNIKRPAFTRMIQDIRDGKITKVWVYRLDRFSRSISDFGQIWTILEKHHVEFESVTEKFDTSTPGGRAMLNIIMTFAQLERETIADRVRDNYYHRFALGSWPGGPAPLGFEIGRITDAESRHVSTLVPNQHADLIRTIYRLYLRPDASCGSVARDLVKKGVKGIRRDGWDNVAISRILKNPVYVMADREIYLYFAQRGIAAEQPVDAFTGVFGCHLVGKRSPGEVMRLSLANHPGLISSQTWLSCQEKLEHNRQLDRTHAGRYSWLSGLLKCAACGYAVKINCIKGHRYLYCSGHTNLNVCRQTFCFDLSELEDAVSEELERLLAQCPDEETSPPPDGGAAARLAQLDAGIQRLVAAYAEASTLSAKYLDREIVRLERERQLTLQSPSVPRQSALRRIIFSSLSVAEKKLVAAAFIDRILLLEDSARVIWKI